MATLKIDVDDDALKSATAIAEKRGTSVEIMVQEFVESIPYSTDDVRLAVKEILRIADRSRASSGPEGRTWTRDDIYEDALARK